MRIHLKIITVLSTLAVYTLAAEPADESAAAGVSDAELKLFAVEITVGPNWDHSKAPSEQAFFSEHSANLKGLRDAGHLIMGARYSDKGLLVFSAPSMSEVTVMMENDPSMQAGIFSYAAHPFSVFYSGYVRR